VDSCWLKTPVWWTRAELVPRLFEPVKIDDGPQIKTKTVHTIGRGGVPVMVYGVLRTPSNRVPSTEYFVRFIAVGWEAVYRIVGEERGVSDNPLVSLVLYCTDTYILCTDVQT